MTNGAKNNKIINYFQESYQEFKKVTWPTRNQAIRLTFIVLGFCLFAAFLMGILDLAFNTGYRFLVDYAAKVAPPAPITAPATTVPGGTPTALTSEAPVKDGATPSIQSTTVTGATTTITQQTTPAPKNKKP